MQNKHYEQIDTLKGLAIFLVVLGHAIIWYPIDLHQIFICQFIFKWLSSVHMPLFFVISGFCYSYRDNYSAFVLKKVKRILIPYLIFNLIDVFPRFFLQKFVNRPRSIGESLVKIVFNGGEYWFLYVLFFIFLTFPLFDKVFLGSFRIRILFLVVILVIDFCMPDVDIFCLKSFVHYLFFFSVGRVMRMAKKNPFEISVTHYKIESMICVLLFGCWIFLVWKGYGALTIVTAFVGIAVLYIISKCSFVKFVFGRFGKYSLQLYLLNGYLLVISRTIIVSIFGVTNAGIIILFNMVIDYIVSYVFIKYFCERYKVIRVLMGL